MGEVIVGLLTESKEVAINIEEELRWFDESVLRAFEKRSGDRLYKCEGYGDHEGNLAGRVIASGIRSGIKSGEIIIIRGTEEDNPSQSVPFLLNVHKNGQQIVVELDYLITFSARIPTKENFEELAELCIGIYKNWRDLPEPHVVEKKY